MAYDGRILARASEILKQRAQANEAAQTQRAEKLAKLEPRIVQINAALRRTVIGVIHKALSSGEDMTGSLEKAKKENQALRKERADILLSLGYPTDYLDRTPLCPLCGDSGYTEQGMCTCLGAIYREEMANSLYEACGISKLLPEEIDLSIYSAERHVGERTSVREAMQYNLHVVKTFVEAGENRQSLCLWGPSGTGKSWFAAAAGYALCERGEYVAYVCAGTLFSCYEDDRFRRMEEARNEIRRWENCDVLILDDLGTENASSQNASVLYQLLNSRLSAHRATVLCTNLSLEEIARRYGAPTASRIGGQFRSLLFRGEDLRGKRAVNFS